MPGRSLNIQCFLEGIRIPFLGAQINITTNQASTATINVVATKEIFGIRPKTHVHLFFWDEAGNGVWRLLWEGEVIGVGYSKSPDSRSAQLSCKDMSNYWDYTLRHMVDLHNAIRIHNKKLYFYGNVDSFVEILPSSAPPDGDIVRTMSKPIPIPQSIQALLGQLTDKIPVYKKVNNTYKVNRQLVLKPDQAVKKLLKASSVQSLIRNIEGRSGGFTPIRDVLLSFCRLVYYNIVSMPSASYVNGNLNTFLLKPNLYGTVPPACNVILPDILTSVTYHRNFMAEPTRMLMHTSSMPGVRKNELFQATYIAPPELGEKLNRIAESERQREEYQGTSTLSDEEKERGILPAEVNMSYQDYFALAPLSKAPGATNIKESVMQVLDYRFQMARYSNRTLSAVTEFNPWLVCNFPAAIFDAGRSYLGVIANISHTISATGGGHTAIDCNLAYEIDEGREDSPVLPEWLSESYKPKNISATYESLLGCFAMEGEKFAEEVVPTGDAPSATPLSASGGKQSKISELTLGLYNPYDKDAPSKYKAAVEGGSAYSFADSYRRRKIATIKDVAKFYGLKNAESIDPSILPNVLESPSGTTTEDGLEADYFLSTRREVIQAYMDDPETGIRASRALDGR